MRPDTVSVLLLWSIERLARQGAPPGSGNWPRATPLLLRGLLQFRQMGSVYILNLYDIDIVSDADNRCKVYRTCHPCSIGSNNNGLKPFNCQWIASVVT